MPGKNALAIPLVLLLLLGGLSGWIERTVRVPAQATAGPSREPESIIENFRASRTGPDGHPRYRLEARTLKHYSGDQPSELVEPRFSQHTATGGATRVVAHQAVLSADGNTVTLTGQVRLDRDYDAASSLVFRTERLVLEPDSGRLSTPGKVEIVSRQWRASAGRMELDSHSRVVKLSGRVRAVFHHVAS